jgi:hypothetical protein
VHVAEAALERAAREDRVDARSLVGEVCHFGRALAIAADGADAVNRLVGGVKPSIDWLVRSSIRRGSLSRFQSEVRRGLAHPALSLSSNLNLGQLCCPTRAFARSILVASLLNLRKAPVTHTKWLGGPEEVLMTKHRTITGFVAVTLLAVAATVATMRSHPPWTNGIVVSAGTTLSKGLTVNANKLPTADFDDRWSAMFAFRQTSG